MLHELQRQFFEGVFGDNDTVAQRILPSNTLSARERLAIYRGSVFGLHTKALGEIYPVCQRLVGARFFEAMCQRYIPLHRSCSPNLQDYGEAFPAFIADFEPARSLPYLADVARLEWAWQRAFHAADETALDVTALENLTEADKPRIVFKLPVSSTLLSSAYPIHRIWDVNQPGYHGDETVNLDTGAVKLLVWRQGYAMHIDLVDSDSWPLLNALAGGTPLGYLPKLLVSLDIALLLPQCVQQGWIADFTLQ